MNKGKKNKKNQVKGTDDSPEKTDKNEKNKNLDDVADAQEENKEAEKSTEEPSLIPEEIKDPIDSSIKDNACKKEKKKGSLTGKIIILILISAVACYCYFLTVTNSNNKKKLDNLGSVIDGIQKDQKMIRKSLESFQTQYKKDLDNERKILRTINQDLFQLKEENSKQKGNLNNILQDLSTLKSSYNLLSESIQKPDTPEPHVENKTVQEEQIPLDETIGNEDEQSAIERSNEEYEEELDGSETLQSEAQTEEQKDQDYIESNQDDEDAEDLETTETVESKGEIDTTEESYEDEEDEIDEDTNKEAIVSLVKENEDDIDIKEEEADTPVQEAKSINIDETPVPLDQQEEIAEEERDEKHDKGWENFIHFVNQSIHFIIDLFFRITEQITDLISKTIIFLKKLI